MSNYNVNYTNIETTPIQMQEGTENNTSLDISIFGNTFLEYGQELNENILHLLENFSCPMNAGNLLGNATPDTNSINGSYNKLLTNPTPGQIWYNSTLKKLYYLDTTYHWRPISTKNDVAANWGIIADGYQLPKPVSATTGYVFPYSECIWSVSPANFGTAFDYMACSTDTLATVNMKYRNAGSTTLIAGVANYLIIGIRGNTNHGVGFAMTPPAISATPTSTPATASNTPTPTITPTVTPTSSQIPSGTVPSTPTMTPTPSRTPSRTPTSTPISPSATRTPAAPSATRTPTSTPAAPTPTPTPSTSKIPPLRVSSYSPTSTSLSAQCSRSSGGLSCLATTNYASVTATGGIPPYTYLWSYYDGATAFVINSPVSNVSSFSSSNTTPGSGTTGHCFGCSARGDLTCPPGAPTNIYCAQVQCQITDSVGNIATGPVFDLTFSFNNTTGS